MDANETTAQTEPRPSGSGRTRGSDPRANRFLTGAARIAPSMVADPEPARAAENRAFSIVPGAIC